MSPRLRKTTPDWLNDTLKIIGGKAGTETKSYSLIALKLSRSFTCSHPAFMSNEGRAQKVGSFSDPHISRILQTSTHRQSIRTVTNWRKLPAYPKTTSTYLMNC